MIYFLRACVLIFTFHSVPYGKTFALNEPLFLTPYILSGNIHVARSLSRVHLPDDTSKIQSYSGFITVNETDNSNMFFWFFPVTECCSADAPLLIWLEGGPGVSGLLTLFYLHGPYFLYPNMTIGLREHAWTKKFNVIYVDNPVGTGYSFTKSEDGYSRNEEQVAENLYEFLQQFFIMFPEYRRNDFYVAGQSYGGKYVPALSYKIHLEGKKSGINFKGMSIGNGWSDPETIMDYAPYFYQLGLVDRKQADMITTITDSVVHEIRSKNYSRALSIFRKLFKQIGPSRNNSIMMNFTGFDYYLNFLFEQQAEDTYYYETYVVKPKVRKAIHVGDSIFHNDDVVKNYLSEDIMQSVKPLVEVLMDNYKVMYYSGQLDLLTPYPMTVNFLHSVRWKHAEEYKEAERIIWRLKDSDYIAGYAHEVKNFRELLVRNVGHSVIQDNSEVALDLITRFIFGESFKD